MFNKNIQQKTKNRIYTYFVKNICRLVNKCFDVTNKTSMRHFQQIKIVKKVYATYFLLKSRKFLKKKILVWKQNSETLVSVAR